MKSNLEKLDSLLSVVLPFRSVRKLGTGIEMSQRQMSDPTVRQDCATEENIMRYEQTPPLQSLQRAAAVNTYTIENDDGPYLLAIHLYWLCWPTELSEPFHHRACEVSTIDLLANIDYNISSMYQGQLLYSSSSRKNWCS